MNVFYPQEIGSQLVVACAVDTCAFINMFDVK